MIAVVVVERAGAAPANGGGAVDLPSRRKYPLILFSIHANEWMMTTNQYGRVSEPLLTVISPSGVSNERSESLDGSNASD